MTRSILQTKLRRPWPGSDLLSRLRLFRVLEQSLDRTLTLVSAPAGYGKTVLVTQWYEAHDGPRAWISLDESDSEVRVFLDYFVSAVRGMFPEACPKTETLLDLATLPPLSDLARYLLNELDAIDTPFVVILDDYHLIQSNEVNKLVGDLLKHAPRNLHLVILTRRDPALPLARMRAANQLGEIRLDDLRFTDAEVEAFLSQTTGLAIETERLARLNEEAEGWPAGLRLISLSLAHQRDPEGFLAKLSGGVPGVPEYLLDEVLASQPPAMRDWLLKTSVLNRFTPDLCEAVCGATPDSEGSFEGETFVHLLQKGGLFCIPLDVRGRWYRYHHMFQHLLWKELKRRTNEADIAALHRKASGWFEDQKLIDEALDHALAAGNTVSAAELVERNRVDALDTSRWYDLRRWLDRLPVELRHARFELLLAQTWVACMQYRISEVSPLLDRIAAADPSRGGAATTAEREFFEGLVALFEGDSARSAELLRSAANRLPAQIDSWVRGQLDVYESLALHESGHSKAAIQQSVDRLDELQLREGVRWNHLVASQAFIYLLRGDCPAASRVAGRLHPVVQRLGDRYSTAWASYVDGCASLGALEFDRARSHFGLATELRGVLHVRAGIDATIGLALASELVRRPEEADEALEHALEYARWTDDPENQTIASSGGARIALLRGDLDAALGWAESYTGTPHAPSMFFFLEIPTLTQCRALVARGSESGLRLAAERLGALRRKVEALHLTCQVVEIAPLQALALHRLDQRNEALRVLEAAVATAAPGRLFRPFAELGASVTGLLKELAARKPAVEPVRQVLAALGSRQARGSKVQPPLDLGLTNREAEILGLVAERLRDKEISGRLGVSTETVKTHLKHIFRKLEVGSRRGAVDRARKLGLLFATRP